MRRLEMYVFPDIGDRLIEGIETEDLLRQKRTITRSCRWINYLSFYPGRIATAADC